MTKHKIIEKTTRRQGSPKRDAGKKQELMMAAAPIKSRSRRMPSMRVGNNLQSPDPSPKAPNSPRLTGASTDRTSKQAPLAIGRTATIGGGAMSARRKQSTQQVRETKTIIPTTKGMIGGLTFKKVLHTVNRPCMWYQPPHDKTPWRLKKNKWRRFEEGWLKMDSDGNIIMPRLFEQQGLSKQKLRQIRRKQFFAFLEGFFEKHNYDSLKLKTLGITYEEDEKQELLKKYFKLFFNEKLDIKKTEEDKQVEQKVKSVNTRLVKRQEPSMLFAQFDKIADDHKDAFLGKSKGILGSFVLQNEVKNFDAAFRQRCNEKQKAPKVLI